MSLGCFLPGSPGNSPPAAGETHGSRAGIPQEAVGPRAVNSLQQHRQSELSSEWHGQMGAAFHDPLGAGEEKGQIQSCPGSWFAPWCAGQTLRVLRSPSPNFHCTAMAHRLGLECLSCSDSLLASAGGPCVPLSCSIITLRVQDQCHGNPDGNPRCEWGRLSFVPWWHRRLAQTMGWHRHRAGLSPQCESCKITGKCSP